MYLGILVGLFGLGVVLGPVVTFLFPILFFAVMSVRFIPYESWRESLARTTARTAAR